MPISSIGNPSEYSAWSIPISNVYKLTFKTHNIVLRSIPLLRFDIVNKYYISSSEH